MRIFKTAFAILYVNEPLHQQSMIRFVTPHCVTCTFDKSHFPYLYSHHAYFRISYVPSYFERSVAAKPCPSQLLILAVRTVYKNRCLFETVNAIV